LCCWRTDPARRPRRGPPSFRLAQLHPGVQTGHRHRVRERPHGEKGAILRSEGLYSSHVIEWTKARKRHHHTVPKSHLRRFADDRNQLMRVVLPGTTRHKIGINDATVEKDFYTVVGPDGEPSDELEDAFVELDGAAETAVRELADERRWPIPRQAREALAAWCALQHLRTPAKRQEGNQMADFIAKASIALGGKDAVRASIEETENRPATTENIEQVWAAATAFDTYVVDLWGAW
jgi:hypothetical protein